MEKKEKIVFACAIILLVIDFLFVLFLNTIPTIRLKKGTIILSLNDTYKEPGYHATKGFSNLTDQVTITDNININKIGHYQVTYSIFFHNKSYQKVRHVIVEDQTPPTITLKGNKITKICPNKVYQEEGYESIDNYDGDLTNEVSVKTNPNFILYSVKDHSGNTYSTKRWIQYEDNEAPTISLKGGNAYSLYIGESYQEPGYIAMDNCDGDITNKVVVTSNLDPNKKGTYEITYEVTDRSLQSTKVSRTVIVLGPKPTSEKIIYLTFDDGPSSTITPTLLDILKEEKVKATFFVLNHGSSMDYLIKREYEEGHTVALHGNSHNYRQIYSSSKAFFDDLSIIQNKVKSITGEIPMIIRFPGGSSNTISKFNPGIMSILTKEAKNRGYHYFDWNVGSGDSGDVHTAEAVYQNVIRGLGNKSNIILMHDFNGNYKTLHAIKKIIQYGKSHGYRFERITMGTPEMHHKVAN